uniref:hypothetical protein n=1 Tax=Lithothamnion corallioides TaxID=1277934 RepID=UPI0023F124C6|nr:hypothetical protein P6G75_pgp069 [Lithothamnion corallioides]WEA77116.1 hypothetical protein [Lithothamnion corallioides]
MQGSLVFGFTAIISIVIIICLNNRNSYYSFFIEFNNAHGIDKGTPVRMRGVNIGSIQNLRIQPNCVLTLAKINSSNIFIPRDSIIETNQTGLLNEAVIDIIPLASLKFPNEASLSPFSSDCENSNIVCNNMYLVGDRGLNYDDLVRSTTRISQRFDDPRFFNLFYVFLQNGIELTDIILELMVGILDVTSIGYIYLQKFLSNSLF